MSKVLLITNIPAPYRVDLFYYMQTHQQTHEFFVIYTNRNEDNRQWVIDERKLLQSTILESKIIKTQGRRGCALPAYSAAPDEGNHAHQSGCGDCVGVQPVRAESIALVQAPRQEVHPPHGRHALLGARHRGACRNSCGISSSATPTRALPAAPKRRKSCCTGACRSGKSSSVC